MNIKLSTQGLFSPELLVRLCPIKEHNEGFDVEPPMPADISSTPSMVLDISEYANTFDIWATKRCGLPIPKSPIRYDEIYNFSRTEKVVPLMIYDLKSKSNVDEILIPLDNLEAVCLYEDEKNKEGLYIPVESLAEFIRQYSIKFYLIKKEVADLNKIYSNPFLATTYFNYIDSRVKKMAICSVRDR